MSASASARASDFVRSASWSISSAAARMRPASERASWRTFSTVPAASFSAGSWDTYTGSLTHAGTIAGVETSLGYDGFGSEGDWKFRAADREVDEVTR